MARVSHGARCVFARGALQRDGPVAVAVDWQQGAGRALGAVVDHDQLGVREQRVGLAAAHAGLDEELEVCALDLILLKVAIRYGNLALRKRLTRARALHRRRP